VPTICLGIESTAHTFGVGIVERREANQNSEFKILSDVKDVYKAPLGSGIHPREASRHHVESSSSVLERALEQSNLRIDDIDLVSYSAGPGLGPCIRVGAVVARALGSYYSKPIIPTNHALGHIELGKALCKLEDPLVLIVSGGHTALTAKVDRNWKIFGETLDLTLGQLIDQLGRFMGLSSPAGPKIEDLALIGASDPKAGETLLALPYTIKGNDVSYSGLLSSCKEAITSGRETKERIAYAVQEIAFDILTEATERALAFSDRSELLVTGGVAANQRLGSIIGSMSSSRGVKFGIIPKQFAGDCGSQIALAGFSFFDSRGASKVPETFVRQSWRLDQISL
jgi:N6-L-threonylcarbamoyladenine synthase